ncbi:putative DNA-binding protein with PD1-like motif [Paracoccus pantotrophus]|uniref:DNA-binding protein with PD1-like motif n=1 Tax=Paracoccus pantotrophus TaxID=82367 RepID=A0AAE6TW40_PARPN|nr:DUF296 domain-containing protein [Paracoccus pantotrophus]QFG36510.1 DUF296 domain-containing protein [Paracoccus pantotrophus]RKS42898.1 putative DNA-binding protein with PD1-like motif [Paracoccus pantotrophus]
MNMVHPGPRAVERVQARRAALRPVHGQLRAGQTVMQAVGELFADHGCKGGVVSLAGLACAPMRYVLPALSTDGLHAAWYSDTHAPAGRWTLDSATATVGRKDGAPFLHCHGIWSDGREVAMGHLLPFDAVIAEDVAVEGLGAAETWFEALPDEETAFTLFTPQGGGDGPGLFARILPGEDVITAIETLAARHGIATARLHGVGSIDHIRFAKGHRMDCLATELRLDGARLARGTAHVPIEVVDIDGHIARGTLERGANPVGVTLELIIEPTGETP